METFGWAVETNLMPWSLRFSIALRQTLASGQGLASFLSRISILGMALAIAILLTVLSVMNGFEREMRDRILALVPHILIQGKSEEEEWNEVKSILATHSSIVSSEPFFAADALLVRGQEVDAARLIAIERTALSSYVPFLSQPVSEWDSDHIILGQALARRMGLKTGDFVTLIMPEINRIVLGGAQPMRVRVGAVLRSLTELDEVLALVHKDVLEPLASSANVVQGMAIRVTDVFSTPLIRWQLTSKISPEFWVKDWRATHGNLYSAIKLSKDLIGFLLLSVILVAAFNIVSSLMLVVTERRKLIATLMVIGAKPTDILAIFFLHGLIVGLIAALSGAIFGGLLASYIPTIAKIIEGMGGFSLLETDVYPLAFVPVDLRGEDFFVIPAMAILVSVFAAAMPAMRAARLHIMKTLAHS